MLDADKEWLFSRLDGCRYGLLSAHGKPLRKQWTIATSSRHFYDVYRNRTCTGSHEHDVVYREWILAVLRSIPGEW